MEKQKFAAGIRFLWCGLLTKNFLAATVINITLLTFFPGFLQAEPPVHQNRQQSVAVGKVLSTTGKVWLDAFGNNEFVPVIQGDLLYEKSSLRTDDKSQASVLLGSEQKTIPAGTLFIVREEQATELKSQSIKWFQDIKEILQATLNQLLKGEESVALGSRGTDAGQSKKIFRMVEDNQVDIDALLTAKQYLEEKRYPEAIISFQSICAPEKLGFYPGELSYLKGTCFFQLGSFQKAREQFLASYQNIQYQLVQKGFKPYFIMSLVFQLGSTYYLLDEEEEAVAYFQKILTFVEDHSSKSYAYLFVIRHFLDAGQKDMANQYTKALERYLGKKEERNKILNYLKG